MFYSLKVTYILGNGNPLDVIFDTDNAVLIEFNTDFVKELKALLDTLRTKQLSVTRFENFIKHYVPEKQSVKNELDSLIKNKDSVANCMKVLLSAAIIPSDIKTIDIGVLPRKDYDDDSDNYWYRETILEVNNPRATPALAAKAPQPKQATPSAASSSVYYPPNASPVFFGRSSSFMPAGADLPAGTKKSSSASNESVEPCDLPNEAEFRLV